MRGTAYLKTDTKTPVVPTHLLGKNSVSSPTETSEPYQGASYDFGRVNVLNANRFSTSSSRIQPKLTINQLSDEYEQEADAMADKVMRMPDDSSPQKEIGQPTMPTLQRKCKHCEDEEKVQRKEGSLTTPSLWQAEDYISSLSGGRSLSLTERNFFEQRMGYDFSKVRLHTDSRANQSAKSINALAYTNRNNIVFNSDEYQFSTDKGKRLLAHELTHIIQQQGGCKINQSVSEVHKSNSHIQRKSEIAEDLRQNFNTSYKDNLIPDDLPDSVAFAIGNSALQSMSYLKIIELAKSAGLLETKNSNNDITVQRSPIDSTVDVMEIFRSAQQAASASGPPPYQLIVGIGAIVVGLAAAGYVLLDRAPSPPVTNLSPTPAPALTPVVIPAPPSAPILLQGPIPKPISGRRPRTPSPPINVPVDEPISPSKSNIDSKPTTSSQTTSTSPTLAKPPNPCTLSDLIPTSELEMAYVPKAYGGWGYDGVNKTKAQVWPKSIPKGVTFRWSEEKPTKGPCCDPAARGSTKPDGSTDSNDCKSLYRSGMHYTLHAKGGIYGKNYAAYGQSIICCPACNDRPINNHSPTYEKVEWCRLA